MNTRFSTVRHRGYQNVHNVRTYIRTTARRRLWLLRSTGAFFFPKLPSLFPEEDFVLFSALVLFYFIFFVLP